MTVTKTQLFAALATTSIPYAADTWWPEKPPALPYVVAVTQGADTFKADDVVRFRTTTYRLELYSHGRDRAAEATIASALDIKKIPYNISVVGLVDETDIYEVAFTVTVAGD